jgi:hypothetical protein
MLNSFNNRQNDFNEKFSFTSYVTKKSTKTQRNYETNIHNNTNIQNPSEINEHKNTIYYPFASTE